MDTLESYLTDEYHSDARDIVEIERLLISVLPTFIDRFNDKLAWPYAISSKVDHSEYSKDKKLSQSTTAMILGALVRLRGHAPESADENHPAAGSGRKALSAIKIGKSYEEGLDSRIKTALELLVDDVIGKSKRLKTKSTTFGTDDVFTLAWLAELTQTDQGKLQLTGPHKQKWAALKGEILVRAEKLREKWKEAGTTAGLFTPKKNGPKPVDHVFQALRLIQTLRRIEGRNYGALPPYYRYFETHLHDQLSFSSIPDSRFDPAELMFCLEGMLLCQKNAVDRSVFDRVIAVLTEAQRQNAYWRPVKPYLATAQGLVLFPVSVEVANSLLRACAIFDGTKLHDTYGSKAITLLRRYCRWIQARTVRFKRQVSTQPTAFHNPNAPQQGEEDIIGWHSEHVNEPETIHLWESSQVVEFLLAYRAALKRHIGRTTLVSSRFKNQLFPDEFPDETPVSERWQALRQTYEPVTLLGQELAIYNNIGESFITPQPGKEPDNYSMLLYGPPGTGKTTVAESIAKALKRRLITVTVSDFLATGSGQVEARAKSVFDVLMAQPSSVVLFDEIDHFLLDRNSVRYGDQDTVFQFMTPGMLTKLNDLRKTNDVLFIIATNYEDRIDAAIKRTGRIDKQYLVLPPDSNRRKAIITDLLHRHYGKTPKVKDWNRLINASLFLGFSDMEAVVKQLKVSDKFAESKLEEMLSDAARSTSIGMYAGRFQQTEEKGKKALQLQETPMREFLCLVAMQLSEDKEFDERETKVMESAIAVLLGNVAQSGQVSKANMENEILRSVPGLARNMVQKMASKFLEINTQISGTLQ